MNNYRRVKTKKESHHARTKNLLTGQGQIFTIKINRADGQRDMNISGYLSYK